MNYSYPLPARLIVVVVGFSFLWSLITSSCPDESIDFRYVAEGIEPFNYDVHYDVTWQDDVGTAARWSAETNRFTYEPGVTCEDVLRLSMEFAESRGCDCYSSLALE